MRNALTSLVTYGHITTTAKRARALRAYADHFFSRAGRIAQRYDDAGDVRRELTRYVKKIIFSADAGKKVVNELVPEYAGKKASGFTKQYKLGARKGDASEKIYLELALS